MQKSILLFLLSAIMLFQGFFSVWVVAGFYANRAFIAENLCIQKDVEENDCQGQCMLMEKLDKAREDEEKNAGNQVKEILLFIQCFDLPQIQRVHHITELSSSVIFYYKMAYSKDFSAVVFKPPVS